MLNVGLLGLHGDPRDDAQGSVQDAGRARAIATSWLQFWQQCVQDALVDKHLVVLEPQWVRSMSSGSTGSSSGGTGSCGIGNGGIIVDVGHDATQRFHSFLTDACERTRSAWSP